MSEALRVGLRFVGLALGIALGWGTGSLLALLGDPENPRATLFFIASAVGGLGYVLGPHLSRAIFRNLHGVVRAASLVDLVAVAVGAGFGGVLSALLAVPLSLLPDPLGATLPFVVAVLVTGLAIVVALIRKRDLIGPWLRSAAPALASTVAPVAAPMPEQKAVLLDTSVIIDGRITDLWRTGFLDARLLVPRFVLEEVQHVADAEDPVRRGRGRRGLEVLERLRREAPDQIEILDVPFDRTQARDVDGHLVRLAKERGIRIVTNDHNLNRVATLQGVRVLNLHELTSALRPPVLPGEELHLKLVQEGRDAGQGVGFLDDGTLVVVDGGRPLVGRETKVTVTRLHQTGAGRMIFAVPSPAVPSHAGV